VEKEYLIRQAPAKALLAFSTPMIIGNLFQQLYTMTDSVIVGQAVGESALAAVGASYALTNVQSIAIGGGVGGPFSPAKPSGGGQYR
jgi:Na+-driven multidrug efflux pump